MIHFLLNNKNIEGFNNDSISFYNLEIDGRIIKLNKQNSNLCFLQNFDATSALSWSDASTDFTNTKSTFDNFINLVYNEDLEPNNYPSELSCNSEVNYIYYSSDPPDTETGSLEGEKYLLFKMKKWTGYDGRPTVDENGNLSQEGVVNHDGGPSLGISDDNKVVVNHKFVANPISSFFNYVYNIINTSRSVGYQPAEIEAVRLGLESDWRNESNPEYVSVEGHDNIYYNQYKLVHNLRQTCTPYILMKIINGEIGLLYISYDNLKTFHKLRSDDTLKITDPSASIFKNPFILLTRILGKNPEGDETTDYIGCKNYECKTDKKPLVSRNYDPTNLNYLTCNNSLDFSPNKSLGTPCDDSICCFNTRCSGEDVCDLHGDNCSDAITSKTLKEDASCMSIENCTNNFPLYCIAQTPSDESQTEFDSIDTDNNGTLEYSELSGNYPNAELNKILGLRENTDTNTFVPLTRQEFDEFFRE